MPKSPRYKEGVAMALLALAYATRKNQDEAEPERMEIDTDRIEEAIDQIECSSYLGADNCVRFPKNQFLIDVAKHLCE